MPRIQEQVKNQIIEDYLNGMKRSDISTKYNVSIKSIFNLIKKFETNNKKEEEPEEIEEEQPEEQQEEAEEEEEETPNYSFKVIQLPEIDLNDTRTGEKIKEDKEEKRIEKPILSNDFYANVKKKYLNKH